MLRIFLARHGQNEDNAKGVLNGHRDLPLTALGVQQARELAQRINESALVFDKIYCSPLIRAKKTAEIVAEELHLSPPQVLPDLIERNFGIMTGKSVDKIAEICGSDILKTDTITYFLSPEGAETFDQLVERANRVLDYIKSHHHHGNILLVGHGDMGKMILAAYFNIPWKDALTLFHFGNSELVELSAESHPDDFHRVKISQHNH
jgi:broad specificity phosphatase PhoE